MQTATQQDNLIDTIPDPAAVRKQLSERLQQARILKQLLKLSEAAAKRDPKTAGGAS